MSNHRVNQYLTRQEKLKYSREIREIIEPYGIRMPVRANESGYENKLDDVLGEFTQCQQQELKDCLEPISVSSEEVDKLISELRSRWDDKQMDLLLGNCKKSVLSSVVGPFGLGAVVAKMDKDGGNITTVHNAENDIFANENDRDRYTVTYNRKDYEDGGFNSKRKQLFQNNEKVIDAYRGVEIPKDGRTHLDHIISAKTIHDDKLLKLSTNKQQRDKIATNSENLVPTDSSLNQSKNDHDLKEWMNASRKDGTTNAEHYGIDKNLADDVYSTAQNQFRFEKSLAVGKHFGAEIAKTGAQEGAKMGLQQAVGLLLTEFFSAAFDEIIDVYKNGFSDSLKCQSFFEALRTRLNRVAERISARWKDALIAFKDGAISGFLSNLVTMLINMLVTTGKRIVRVIREGFMSIMNALKMVLFPPEGMTYAEAGDAALKLLATGITVSLGILAEEVVEKSVSAFFTANIPPLAPYAGMVSTVFVGAMTGIASALLVYALDKLDILGVQTQRKHDFIINELDNLIAESDSNINAMYEDEMGRMDVFLTQLQDA